MRETPNLIILIEAWAKRETNGLCGIVFCFLGFTIGVEGKVVRVSAVETQS